MSQVMLEEEHKKIQQILKNYELTVYSITKENSFYKIDTDSGLKSLYSIRHGKDNIKKDLGITEFLAEKDFNNVITYVKTADNKLFVKNKKNYYYLKNFVDSKECDVTNFEEILNSIILLANFHNIAYGYEIAKFSSNSKKPQYLPAIFSKQLTNLIKYGRLIEKKGSRSDFDKTYGEWIKEFYQDGILAYNLLERSNYDSMLKKAKYEKHICHGKYYYHNVYIDSFDNYYITDFSNISVDIRMQDLGKFIRKLLSRHEYMWDFNKCRKLIEAYSSIIKLSKEEICILLAIIIFPFRFCKLGKVRFEKNKPMIEIKYQRKLEKQINHVKHRKDFIRDFTSSYEISL